MVGPRRRVCSWAITLPGSRHRFFWPAIQRHGPDASNAHGPLVNDALGIAGLICVVIAGWTTANPTIYRAGLAFQSLFPNRSRFVFTLLAGLIATLAGLFPAIAMRLLDFVGIYGTILAPMGAVIFVDYYFIRKLGLKDNFALTQHSPLNLAALYAYILPVIGAAYYWNTHPVVHSSHLPLFRCGPVAAHFTSYSATFTSAGKIWPNQWHYWVSS